MLTNITYLTLVCNKIVEKCVILSILFNCTFLYLLLSFYSRGSLFYNMSGNGNYLGNWNDFGMEVIPAMVFKCKVRGWNGIKMDVDIIFEMEVSLVALAALPSTAK